MRLMTQIKVVKHMNRIGAGVGFAVASLLIPFIAADMVLADTGWWMFMIPCGIFEIKMSVDLLKKAKGLARYEEAGRAVLTANPTISDVELAQEILKKISDPARGKV